MSKFCTKCGRPIPEGAICSCQLQGGKAAAGSQPGNQKNSAAGQPGSQQNPSGQPIMPNQRIASQEPNGNNQRFVGQQASPSQPYVGQQAPPNQQFYGQAVPPNQPYGGQQLNGQQYKTQASAFAQNFLGKVLNLVKNPVTAGKALIMEADLRASLLLAVFQGIFSALFAMAVAGKVSQYIKAASGLADGISSGLGSVVAGALSMPYFRIFIVTVLFSLVLACILALMMMVGHMALQIPVSFQQMLSAASIRSAVLVPSILLSIVIFELSAGIGIALFVLVNIWGFAAMIVAMSAFIRPEKINLFVLMVSVVILLFTFIAMFALSEIWTLYLPDLMRTAVKGMDGLSWNQILEEFIGDLY